MVEGNYWTVTVKAAQDFRVASTLHRPVDASGAIVGTGSAALGLSKSQCNSGQHLTLGYAGHMKAYAGAAITAGNRVSITTSGWLITAVSGSGPVVGRALAAANSGDLFSGIFDFANCGTTN